MKIPIPIVAILFTTPLLAQIDPVSEAAKLSDQGLHSESAKLLESALSTDPGNENVNYRLAAELVFDRRYTEARKRLQELVRSQNPEIASMARNNLATLDRIEAEQRKASSAVAAPDPNYLRKQQEYLQSKAKLDRKQKAYDLITARKDVEAVEHIDELEVLGEVTTELLLEQGYALERLGKIDDAIQVLKNIPPEKDQGGQARLMLAGLLAKDGRSPEAYKIWSDLRKGDGDSTASRIASSQISYLAPSLDLDRWAWGELDLYGTYLSRYEIGIAAGRIREGTFVPGARWIEPFVQGDFSLDSTATGSQGISSIYNENLAGFHAGVRVRPFPTQSFVLYALGGVQKDLRGTEKHHAKWFSELITGVNGYWAWGPGKEWTASDLKTTPPGGLPQLNPKLYSPWSLNSCSPLRFRSDWFVEAGGDAAYYTRLTDGIAYLQSRQGFRVLQLGKAAAIDGYTLQNLTMDTTGNYYDNYFEGGPGARLITTPIGAAVFTTSVDYVLGSYLGRNADNTRGNTGANYSDFRLTMSLSLRW